MEFKGLSIEFCIIVPSFEVIVPAREDAAELPFIESKASARSKTLPLNIALYEALCGVDGTVACTAGPRAALCGVIGSGTWEAGDLTAYEEPLGIGMAKYDQGEFEISEPHNLTAF
jgi:hypothetical protein